MSLSVNVQLGGKTHIQFGRGGGEKIDDGVAL